VAKAAAAFIQRLPLRMLTSLLLPALLLEPVAAAADVDVGVAILLRKRFQRFHRGTESESDAEGTLLLPILDTREDEGRTNVGLLTLFDANLPAFDNPICLTDLPVLALGAKAST
jgi:hypothetical protein